MTTEQTSVERDALRQPVDAADDPPVLTIAEFRDVIKHLDGSVPVSIAVRDQHHFNTLLADIPVVGASVTHGPSGPVVILDVLHVT